MKKIGKLLINPEKVIKNDELVNLRGGTYGEDTPAQKKLTCTDGMKPPFTTPVCKWYFDAQSMIDHVEQVCTNDRGTFADC